MTSCPIRPKSVAAVARQSKDGRLSPEQKKKFKASGDSFYVALDEVFLPEQVARLDQLILRNAIRESGYGGYLDRLEELAEAKLSEAEREAFLKECATVDKATREEMDRAKGRVELRIADELSPDQRSKFKNAIGDYYEYVPTAVKPYSPRVVYPY